LKVDGLGFRFEGQGFRVSGLGIWGLQEDEEDAGEPVRGAEVERVVPGPASCPLRAVYLSRHNWLGGLVNLPHEGELRGGELRAVGEDELYGAGDDVAALLRQSQRD